MHAQYLLDIERKKRQHTEGLLSEKVRQLEASNALKMQLELELADAVEGAEMVEAAEAADSLARSGPGDDAVDMKSEHWQRSPCRSAPRSRPQRQSRRTSPRA